MCPWSELAYLFRCRVGDVVEKIGVNFTKVKKRISFCWRSVSGYSVSILFQLSQCLQEEVFLILDSMGQTLERLELV